MWSFKTSMDGHLATLPCSHSPRQHHRIPFSDQVKIQTGMTEQQVAHVSPDEIEWQLLPGGLLRHRPEQPTLRRCQGLIQADGKIKIGRVGIGHGGLADIDIIVAYGKYRI